MDLMEKIRQIERLDQLIRMKATGSPEELAGRLRLSLRHTYRLINELKILGFPISYNKIKKSYCYTNNVKIHFEIKVEEEKMLSIKGGGLFLNSRLFGETESEQIADEQPRPAAGA